MGLTIFNDETKESIHVKDTNTADVIMDLAKRAEVGYNKYQVTLGENNKDDFLKHMYEELLDAAQYTKKLRNNQLG